MNREGLSQAVVRQVNDTDPKGRQERSIIKFIQDGIANFRARGDKAITPNHFFYLLWEASKRFGVVTADVLEGIKQAFRSVIPDLK